MDFENNHVKLKIHGEQEVDVVVFCTGYHFTVMDVTMVSRLKCVQVPFLPAEIQRSSYGHPLADQNESRTWKNLFFIGFPCARGLNSEYLRGVSKLLAYSRVYQRDMPRLRILVHSIETKGINLATITGVFVVAISL